MREWKFEGYVVEEREFDHDLHQFVVVKDGEDIFTFTPDSIESMNDMAEEMNAGTNPEGWEDGNGNTFSI